MRRISDTNNQETMFVFHIKLLAVAQVVQGEGVVWGALNKVQNSVSNQWQQEKEGPI